MTSTRRRWPSLTSRARKPSDVIDAHSLRARPRDALIIALTLLRAVVGWDTPAGLSLLHAVGGVMRHP